MQKLFGRRFAFIDRALLRGSVVVAAGMLFSRVLGFVFYLILAHEFNPKAYGEIQYSIVLADIIAIGTQPFGQHVLARFIGVYKESPAELRKFLSNGWAIFAVVFLITLLATIQLLIIVPSLNIGILIVVIGTTFFYAYWGLARGFLASGKLAIAYFGCNAVQLLLVLVLIQILNINSTYLALAIYGGSFMLPFLLLMLWRTFPLTFDFQMISWNEVKPILLFSFPIWLSHGAYVLNHGLDILLLKQFADLEIVGKYSLIKAISAIFFFVPSGISTVLMPRIASLPGQKHQSLLVQSLLLAFLINIGILISYFAFGEWLITTLFSSEYETSLEVVIILFVGMIIYGLHTIVTSVQVGEGRADRETISRMVILGSSAITGFILIPIFQELGAALSVVVGAISGLIAYGILIRRNI